MTTSIIFAILGFFFLISSGVIDNLPNKEKLFKKWPYVRWVTFSFSIILILISGYYQFVQPVIKSRIAVFVTPKSFNIHAGRDEMFIMKITNNKDMPVYDVHLSLRIVSGDLTTNQIKIEPLDEGKVTGFLGDKKGGVSVAFDVIMIHAIPQGSTKKEPTLIDMILNNINPNTTKDFKLSINGMDKENSKIDLLISRVSEEPNPVIGGKFPIKWQKWNKYGQQRLLFLTIDNKQIEY